MSTLSSLITPSGVVTPTGTQTLTNKTISGSSNTITNIGLTTAVTGQLPVANGGIALTTIAARSIPVANATDTYTTVTPSALQSIRINAGNTAWEAYTPSAGGAAASWSRKTTTYTAVSGDKLIADTSGGTFTITLPATPTTGNYVEITDGSDWFTTNLTVARNGSTVEGVADDILLNIKGINVYFIFDGTTWQVTATLGKQGNGNTTGPVSSINNGIALFDGTTGKIIKDSGSTLPSGTVVGTSDSQTLTNKILSNILLDGAVTEDVYTLTGTVLSPVNGTVQVCTLSSSITFTENLTTGQSMTLMIADGSGTFAATWPTVTWVNSTIPVLPQTGYAVINFWKVSTTLYAAYIGDVA